MEAKILNELKIKENAKQFVDKVKEARERI
jgi:hypothetical protein